MTAWQYPVNNPKILLLKGHVFRCHVFFVCFFQLQDICKIHIDDVLKDFSETVLIELPESDASSVQHLIDRNEVWMHTFSEPFSSSKLKHKVKFNC